MYPLQKNQVFELVVYKCVAAYTALLKQHIQRSIFSWCKNTNEAGKLVRYKKTPRAPWRRALDRRASRASRTLRHYGEQAVSSIVQYLIYCISCILSHDFSDIKYLRILDRPWLQGRRPMNSTPRLRKLLTYWYAYSLERSLVFSHCNTVYTYIYMYIYICICMHRDRG